MGCFSAFTSVFSASYRIDLPHYSEFPSLGSGLLMVQMACCWICLFDAGVGGINRQLGFLEAMNQKITKRSAIKWSVQPAMIHLEDLL